MSVTESIAYIDRVAHLAGLQIPKPFHRFYTTSDKKLLAVGILSPNDQKKFLECKCLGRHYSKDKPFQ